MDIAITATLKNITVKQYLPGPLFDLTFNDSVSHETGVLVTAVSIVNALSVDDVISIDA